MERPKFRYLKRNHSTASPGLLVFVDTETIDVRKDTSTFVQEHKLRLGCATMGRLEDGKLTRRKTLDFHDNDTFWKWVETNSSNKIATWIFIHNVAFDSVILDFWNKFDTGEFSFERQGSNYVNKQGQECTPKKQMGFVCLESPPIIVEAFHRSGYTLYMVDTLNYWTTSLENIGKAVGQKKLTMPPVDADDAAWFHYCRGDVDVLEKAVLGLVGWVKENDLGKFRFTAPSQSMAAFRHRFNNQKIVLHEIDSVRKLERDSYYGGRLEMFYSGYIPAPDSLEATYRELGIDGILDAPVGPVYELDVASMYPSVMRSNLYPRCLIDWSENTPGRIIAPNDVGIDMIAEVEIETNSETFPIRHVIGTCFPLGRYTTVLAGPELRRARKAGVIQRVLRWAQYDLAPIFTEFVDYFWEYRITQERLGNDLNASLAKLMLNSLYGKFGQQINGWKDVGETDIYEPWEVGMEKSFGKNDTLEYRMIGKLLQLRQEPQEHPSAFPAIASYVTAYGREMLLNFNLTAGHGHFFYNSTDALYTDSCGYQNLVAAGVVEDRTLGKLGLKHHAADAEFSALHNYRLGTKVCHGSVKKTAIPVAHNLYNELHFESLKTSLRRGTRDTILITPCEKRAADTYRKGVIQPSGWVTPLIFPLESQRQD